MALAYCASLRGWLAIPPPLCCGVLQFPVPRPHLWRTSTISTKIGGTGGTRGTKHKSGSWPASASFSVRLAVVETAQNDQCHIFLFGAPRLG